MAGGTGSWCKPVAKRLAKCSLNCADRLACVLDTHPKEMIYESSQLCKKDNGPKSNSVFSPLYAPSRSVCRVCGQTPPDCLVPGAFGGPNQKPREREPCFLLFFLFCFVLFLLFLLCPFCFCGKERSREKTCRRSHKTVSPRKGEASKEGRGRGPQLPRRPHPRTWL